MRNVRKSAAAGLSASEASEEGEGNAYGYRSAPYEKVSREAEKA